MDWKSMTAEERAKYLREKNIREHFDWSKASDEDHIRWRG